MTRFDARPARSGWGGETQRVTVRVPADLLDAYEALVDDGVYPNRSAAVREAMAQHVEEDGA